MHDAVVKSAYLSVEFWETVRRGPLGSARAVDAGPKNTTQKQLGTSMALYTHWTINMKNTHVTNDRKGPRKCPQDIVWEGRVMKPNKV